MPARTPTVVTYRGADATLRRRPENLALAFQEIFTAIVRLRANRQAVTDAEVFRAQFREGLRLADEDARNRGYTPEDVQLATFAVVAFLDESVLSAHNPALASWPRLPLQEQLFGGHMAGETFFRNLEEILRRRDSQEVADLLEVYELCLLLGYRGRYGAESSGLRSVLAAVEDKIRRIRGGPAPLCPAWVLPADPPQRRKTDAWLRRLTVLAIIFFVLAVGAFVGFTLSLHSGLAALHGAVVAGRP
jgi:type VI secretion system protein ImpK